MIFSLSKFSFNFFGKEDLFDINTENNELLTEIVQDLKNQEEALKMNKKFKQNGSTTIAKLSTTIVKHYKLAYEQEQQRQASKIEQ